MKKQIWLAAGIAGMLIGSPTAQAEINVRIGERGDRPPSYIHETRPNFINLSNFGFSVSIGSPQDIISCDGRYYLNHNGRWFVSDNFRGPWILVRDGRLPYQIRRHRWEEIRNYRDVEYRRFEGRNNRGNNFRDSRDRNNNQDQHNNNQNNQGPHNNNQDNQGPHNNNQDQHNNNQNNPDDRRPNDSGRRN